MSSSSKRRSSASWHEGLSLRPIFITPTGQSKSELYPESESRFSLKAVAAQIDFERGPDGQATGLVLHQGGRNVPGKRVK
jgi:hypothetical protein